MSKVAPCPNCSATNLYRSREIGAGGGHAPNYLPGLGGFLRTAKFTLVVCRDCGLTRFFASADATAKLESSPKWQRIRQ